MHKLSFKLNFFMVIVDTITYAKKYILCIFRQNVSYNYIPKANILLDVLTLLVRGEIKKDSCASNLNRKK